ncbi:MAG: preprotein translocase subunit SecG, partial [Archaeoglobaceae archaeon]
MTVLIWILSAMLVALCGVIVFLILGQDVRGGGLAGALGGGSVQSAFGSRTTETILKVTAYLVAAIFVMVIILAKIQTHDTTPQGLTDSEEPAPATAPADTTDTTETTETT